MVYAGRPAVPKRASLFFRVPRLPPCLLLLGALAVLACPACADDPVVEPDDHVAVKLAFDQVTYVDAALAPRKISERIRAEVQSILPALRKADVLLLSNTQIEIDVPQLKKDPVTVVDPASPQGRPALRVHYRYVALAQVPKALAAQGDLALGVLHDADGAHAEAILTECTANGEHERESVGDLGAVFDPSLESCTAAMAREQAAIDAARGKLPHADQEIVPLELARTYLPVKVHLQRRQQGDAGDYALPTKGGHIDNPTVRGHEGPFIPGVPAAPAGDQPGFVVQRVADRVEVEPLTDEERADEAELRRQSQSLGGADLVAIPGTPAPSYGGYTYLQPNYAMVYFALVAFVVLLVGKKKRDQVKR